MSAHFPICFWGTNLQHCTGHHVYYTLDPRLLFYAYENEPAFEWLDIQLLVSQLQWGILGLLHIYPNQWIFSNR